MRPLSTVVICLIAQCSHSLANNGSVFIRGKIGIERVSDRATHVSIRVWSMRLRVSTDGQVARPSKQEIFAASSAPREVTAGSDGEYVLAVAAGHYCVFAFADLNDDGRWNPGTPEPFGWYAAEASGRFDIVHVEDTDKTDVNFTLRAPKHFSDAASRTSGGTLRKINGYTVLQLHGDAHARGFAHGKLVARQIVDFFRFYILEDKIRSASEYRNGFAKFVHSHFAYPKPYVTECEAVIEGMRASGTDLHVKELGRDFSLTDLYAINGYIETRAMRSSCTQFAVWGERTRTSDVSGGMLTGRNMDGEIDIRKVTVSHFLLFAVDPSEPDQKRYVSMMWPGFVATLSGINEDGFYAMENAGTTGPGNVVDQLVPISWTMRETLARLDANSTPNTVQQLIDSFDNSAGGSSGPGCIILFANPNRGQANPAFVYEGDRFGDAMRIASSVRPKIPEALVLSNHHHAYGIDADHPDTNFGRSVSFSSRWRYETGMHKLEAWDRRKQTIGTAQMRELLQAVAHGTTEYSIITRPNKLEFDVAVASMKAELWDAPYRRWTTFEFDDVFPQQNAQ